MTQTMTHTRCPHWCATNHDPAHRAADPDHFAPRGTVALTLQPRLMMSSGTAEHDWCAVSLQQLDDEDGQPRVLLDRNDFRAWEMTPAEARRLAAELVAAADEAGSADA